MSIGRPIWNTRAYVLDGGMEPAPVGIWGELYLGGAGLARGYVGRGDLTAERFVPDALSGEAGGRLYRSGDVARWDEEGRLEYQGRKDQQVKIRGFRIELGEVEAVLASHAGVKEAVVVAREERGGGKRLVGYVVREGEQGAELSGELRKYVQGKLPEYMVPSVVVVLEKLPLTVNGKVDRKQLPEPEAREQGGEYVGPRNATEEIVAGIWEEVLGLERVGVEENFFELGGHSLLATQVVSRVREALGVEVGLRRLFEEPTVAGLARGAGQAERSQSGVVKKGRRGERTELSYAQQRLWFLDQLRPGNAFYNMPAAVRLKGELAVEALERGIGEVVRRHEVLRTRYVSQQGRAWQQVEEWGGWKLEVEAVGSEEEARERAREEAGRAFDLEQGPVLRTRLLRLDEQDHVLLVTVHHIAADGWSIGVLIGELGRLYEAYRRGEESPLAELEVQYGDYAEWQREWLKGEVREQQLGYWRKQLAGVKGTELPADRARPGVQSYAGASHSVRLSGELSGKLKELSRREGVTLYMTLLAALQALLSRYTGEEEIVVGTPVANRDRQEIEGLIGFFVNTLVMRGDLSGDPSFRELLGRVRRMALEAYAHQNVPFEQIVEELEPQRDLSRNPLFQVVLQLMNAPQGEVGLGNLEARVEDAGVRTTRFDVEMHVAEVQGSVQVTVIYSTALYEAERMRRMGEHLEVLLEEVVERPATRLRELRLLSEGERRQVVEEWNGTEREGTGRSLVERIEEQAGRQADAIAVVSGDQQVSYGELNRRANQLGGYLRERGVGPERRVGVCLERSVEMVVGLLVILKAGGAYVPLDAKYPRERLEWMARDAGTMMLLTQERLAGEWRNGTAGEMFCVDTEWEQVEQIREVRQWVGEPGSLAYVIYTSGSTGKPKGVQVSHSAL